MSTNVSVPEPVVYLTVHGIGAPERDVSSAESQTWISEQQFEQLLDAVGTRDDVRITFDDGNASDITIALPRLIERGLTADFFVLAGMLGEPGWLSADHVRQLDAAGMTIGSHGWAHVDWRRLPDAAGATQEYGDAPTVLGKLIDRTVSTVAIPFGSYDRRVLSGLRRAGATCVYTSDGGRARPGTWLRPRNSARHDLDASWLAGVLDERSSVRGDAVRLAKRTVKRWRGRP
ncbi:polysaccharide deacetylase family protein [Catellatospora chokoriensis]|uniref:Glycosyl transferase n=1 Tax=Catellatospora chokoriensis TaxID=310353 RepID=A0A8J3K0L8_9ACTN|nr:glycosyl transferase [Catellatospora chokoriensis]